MKVGDIISFSGRTGTTRHGIIEKIWNVSDGTPWAHVKTKRVYIWETEADLIFCVCLDPGNFEHDKCVVHP